MTHTVEGWAVQWRRLGARRWCFEFTADSIKVFRRTHEAVQSAREFPDDYETRVIRVRQTTQVIEG